MVMKFRYAKKETVRSFAQHLKYMQQGQKKQKEIDLFAALVILSRTPWLMTVVCSKENAPPKIREAPVALVPILCANTDIAHSRRTTRTERRRRNLRFGDGKIAPFDNNCS